MENNSSIFSQEVKQKAKEIIQILKDSDSTQVQLREVIPFGTELVQVLNCLAYTLKEEFEQDKEMSQDFRQYVNEVTAILKECLQDNQITENERIKIIEALDNFGKYYSEVEKERKRQSGKNKRFAGGLLAGLAAIIIAIIGLNKGGNNGNA